MKTPEEIAEEVYEEYLSGPADKKCEYYIAAAINAERKVLEEKETEIEQWKLRHGCLEQQVKELQGGAADRLQDKVLAQEQVIERMREALNWVTHLINGVSKNGSSEISTGEWEECNKRRQEILSPPAQSKEGEK